MAKPLNHSRALNQIRQLHHYKSNSAPIGEPLGPAMIDFFKQSVTRRQTKLTKVAECWGALVPQLLSEHCALESFSKGTLTVIVDSSSHLYELKQLLLAGIEKQLMMMSDARSAGLRKIVLRSGRWYAGDRPDDRRAKFSS